MNSTLWKEYLQERKVVRLLLSKQFMDYAKCSFSFQSITRVEKIINLCTEYKKEVSRAAEEGAQGIIGAYLLGGEVPDTLLTEGGDILNAPLTLFHENFASWYNKQM